MVSTISFIVIMCFMSVCLSSFCAGFILGRYSLKEYTKEVIKVEQESLDPISPREQELIRVMEEEERKNVWEQDEE